MVDWAGRFTQAAASENKVMEVVCSGETDCERRRVAIGVAASVDKHRVGPRRDGEVRSWPPGQAHSRLGPESGVPFDQGARP